MTYSGVPREVLLAYKEHGRRCLAPVLGQLLFAAIRAMARALRPEEGRLCLVPIPTSPPARRRRGGDHLRPVVNAAHRYGRDWLRVRPLLRTVASRADSVGLGAAARARNVAGGFALRRWEPREKGGSLVLVDDVVASGATLAEAARTLRKAGLAVAGAVTVAAVS